MEYGEETGRKKRAEKEKSRRKDRISLISLVWSRNIFTGTCSALYLLSKTPPRDEGPQLSDENANADQILPRLAKHMHLLQFVSGVVQ